MSKLFFLHDKRFSNLSRPVINVVFKLREITSDFFISECTILVKYKFML